MHRLKQSFKHLGSLDREKKIRTSFDKNAGAAAVTRYSACPGIRRERAQSKAPSNRVSFDSQPSDQIKERLRLTLEQEVIRERTNSGNCSRNLGRGGPDHGTLRQTLTDKLARLRKDQVRLIELGVARIEVGEFQTRFWIRDTGQRLGHRVTGLVMP